MSVRLTGAAGKPIPVARPADLPPIKPVAEAAVETPWYELTAESVKGWSTSLSVHAVVLLALGLWVFSPSSTPPRSFDTRLAGSDRGVEEGLTVTGGLNTEIELGTPPEPIPSPSLTGLKPLDLAALEPTMPALTSAPKPSAGGGMNNSNPGAGNGDGFGLARFGDGGESIRGVAVKVGDPQFTLLWDNDVDLDLHVIEPGGKEIYWEDPKGKHGGELDVDNTKGFGPENVYWLRESEDGGEKVKGPGPPGEYKWFVVYWGGFGGIPKPTRWKVRIKHAGKVAVVAGRFQALNERSRIYTLKIDGAAVPETESATSAR